MAATTGRPSTSPMRSAPSPWRWQSASSWRHGGRTGLGACRRWRAQHRGCSPSPPYPTPSTGGSSSVAVRTKEYAVLRRVGVAGLVMGAVVVVGGPAWAHVTISPDSAPKGSDAVLAFNVPDESDTLSTTQVAIFFPTDHPIAEALV